MNIINKDTKKVGFAVKENIVLGYYCPAAPTDADALMRSTPRKIEIPVQPKLRDVRILLKENALCPEIDKDGRRPQCGYGMCCGKSIAMSNRYEIEGHCKNKNISGW